MYMWISLLPKQERQMKLNHEKITSTCTFCNIRNIEMAVSCFSFDMLTCFMKTKGKS